MACSHTTTEDVFIRDQDYEGNDTSYWDTQEVSCEVDMDLHRYKCRKCGRVGYYSQSAREHFEGTKPSSFIEESNARYTERKKND